MSRYNTPDSDIGKLTIGGSSARAKLVMPATTRSATQRHRELAASQRASSGGTAGSSRVVAGPSNTVPSSALTQSSRQAEVERSSTRRRRRGGNGDDHGSSSDDDDSSDDNDAEVPSAGVPFEGQKRSVVFLIMAVYTDTYLTPGEFVRVTPNAMADWVTDSTQHLRRVADQVFNLVQDRRDLLNLQGAADVAFCLTQIVKNLRQRSARIGSDLAANIRDSNHRDPVPVAVSAFVKLHEAIDGLIAQYRAHLTPEDWSHLAGTMVEVLRQITQRDTDLYVNTQVNRPPYARASGNLYRSWLLEGKPVAFLAVLEKIPIHVLAQLWREIGTSYQSMSTSAAANPTDAQTNLHRKLGQIYYNAYNIANAAQARTQA